MRDYTKLYIAGEWVSPSGGKVADVVNPATEKTAGQITMATAADVDRAVAAARAAFVTFSQSSRAERLALLSSILGVYAKRSRDLAEALVEDLGAPRKFAEEPQVASAFCTCRRRS